MPRPFGAFLDTQPVMVAKLRQKSAMNIARLLDYRHNGLVVTVVQDVATSEVLMVAFMNAEAVMRTLTTGMAHYYSTTRQRLWLKGEKSGHHQHVEEVYIDCDGDALLLKVRQVNGACHKGYRSCFYRKLQGSRVMISQSRVFRPKDVYDGTSNPTRKKDRASHSFSP